MTTFLVHMAKPQWTEEALHLACAMAHTSDADLVMLELIPVQHYSWLGTSFGFQQEGDKHDEVKRYRGIAASYDVELSVQPMQYISLIGALVEAVELLEAQALFTHIPTSSLPLWRSLQIWNLHRQLARQGCTLHTLDQPVWTVASATQLGALRQHN